jgi:hypothetical protein
MNEKVNGFMYFITEVIVFKCIYQYEIKRKTKLHSYI